MKQNSLAVLCRSLHKRLFLLFDHGPSVDVIQSEVFSQGLTMVNSLTSLSS